MGNQNSKQKDLNVDEIKFLIEIEEEQRRESLRKIQITKQTEEEQQESKQKFENLINKSIQNTEEISKIKNKDLTILLGSTGSGKSTLFNYLLGSKLEKVFEKGCFEKVIRTKENEIEYSEIGHKFDISKTEKIKFFENENFKLLDTQGLFDSRGIEYQINFSLLLENILKNCKGVKFIIPINYNNLKSAKANGVKKIFKFIKKLFVHKENIEKYKNSFLILITRENEDIPLIHMKETFISMENDIIKILKDRIFFYDPLDEKKKGALHRKEFIEEIIRMNFIREKNLQISFNIEEKIYLKDIFNFANNKIRRKIKKKKTEDLIKFYCKLEIFQNTENNFLKKENEIIDNYVKTDLHNKEDCFIKFAEIGIFPICKLILKNLEMVFEKNENLKKNKEINYREYLEKKQLEFKQNTSNANNLTKKQKEELIKQVRKKSKEECKKKIDLLLTKKEEKKQKYIKQYNNEKKNTEEKINFYKTKKKTQKVIKFQKYLKKIKSLKNLELKRLENFYEEEIRKIQKLLGKFSLASGIFGSVTGGASLIAILAAFAAEEAILIGGVSLTAIGGVGALISLPFIAFGFGLFYWIK